MVVSCQVSVTGVLIQESNRHRYQTEPESVRDDTGKRGAYAAHRVNVLPEVIG